MNPASRVRRRLLAGAAAHVATAGLAGCAAPPRSACGPLTTDPPAHAFRVVNRLTWGANDATLREALRVGLPAYVDAQLDPQGPAQLPAAVQARIDALGIARTPLPELLRDLEDRRARGAAEASEDARKAARQAWQQALTRASREAASRHLLRALHSPQQLREHMTWFWLNHFNVHQHKGNLRAMVGDYEERAIRPHALGRFRVLLGAATRHPAMLRYLDNEHNVARHANENHARELLELHTLGVDGGYAQRDVQELARVLTGWGINLGDPRPVPRPQWAALVRRDGAYEFSPARHDFGDKVVLGRSVRGRGPDELDEVLDLLAAHPSTASFVSRRMAQYLLADEPPPALVAAMASAFRRSDGDIAATLRVLVGSEAFASPATRKFKDPMHFVVSALRAGFEDRPVLNTMPLQGWLARSGEGLYDHPTPDGYGLGAAAWTASGQLAARFEFARAIGRGNADLWRDDAAAPASAASPEPRLAQHYFDDVVAGLLGPSTRSALAQAGSLAEWNALFFASPEFMYR